MDKLAPLFLNSGDDSSENEDFEDCFLLCAMAMENKKKNKRKAPRVWVDDYLLDRKKYGRYARDV